MPLDALLGRLGLDPAAYREPLLRAAHLAAWTRTRALGILAADSDVVAATTVSAVAEMLNGWAEQQSRPPVEGESLVTAAEVRTGVLALLAERQAPTHRHLHEADRQHGEVNALEAVLRLIDTGDWRTPSRPTLNPARS